MSPNIPRRIPSPEAQAVVSASRQRRGLPAVDVSLVVRTERFFTTALDATLAPGVRTEAVIPVNWGVVGGLVAVHSDGTVATRPIGEHPPKEVLELGNRNLLSFGDDYAAVPTVEPTGESITAGFLEMGRPVPDVVRALNARQAALTGDSASVETFTREGLGFWSGWREPVSTALIGTWADPLFSEGRLSPDALKSLRHEARTLNQQLTPLWRRKLNADRLWSLDFSFGDGMTTYDVVASGPDPFEVLTGTLPDEPRIAAVLAQLAPIERAVAMAWANTRTTTWTEAAAIVTELDTLLVIGLNPSTLGTRVRRKLQRLGIRYVERAAAAAAWRQEQA